MVTTNDPCQIMGHRASGVSPCGDAIAQGIRDNTDPHTLREKRQVYVGPGPRAYASLIFHRAPVDVPIAQLRINDWRKVTKPVSG